MRVRAELLSRLYRVGFPIMKSVWFVTRPRKRGAKCVVWRGDEVLLVRQTYGDRGRWDFPGGLVKRNEEPLDGARRELREETGLEARDWMLMGVFEARLDNRRDRLHCFSARLDGDAELEIDGAEILDARWFARESLPAGLSPHTRRILALNEEATAERSRLAPSARRDAPSSA